jgi:hypothetical protein
MPEGALKLFSDSQLSAQSNPAEVSRKTSGLTFYDLPGISNHGLKCLLRGVPIQQPNEIEILITRRSFHSLFKLFLRISFGHLSSMAKPG